MFLMEYSAALQFDHKKQGPNALCIMIVILALKLYEEHSGIIPYEVNPTHELISLFFVKGSYNFTL